MIWKTFLSVLDDTRASIRANRELAAAIIIDDPILRDLAHLVEEAGQAKKPTKLIEVELDDAGNPIFPQALEEIIEVSKRENRVVKGKGEVSETISVEGAVVKKIIPPRENKPAPSAPNVEEATEETVGKD